jgi:hypothetical protein
LTTASTFQDNDTEMQSKENAERRTDNDKGEIISSSSRSLTEQEQEEITVLLRAWVSLFWPDLKYGVCFFLLTFPSFSFFKRPDWKVQTAKSKHVNNYTAQR